MAGQPASRPSRSERYLSWGLLGLLVVITVLIFAFSRSPDPYLSGTANTALPHSHRQTAPSQSLETALPDLSQALAPALVASEKAEHFDAQTLADKIDGKAELYLEAGFQSLKTQRVKLKEHSDIWAEFFLFVMHSDQSAFAVFSQQRRSSAIPIPDVAFGYRAANVVCAAAGPYYVEGVGSAEDEHLMEALTETLSALVRSIPSSDQILRTLEWFPESLRAHERAVLYLGSAFGYDGFQETFAVPTGADMDSMTVFVAKSVKDWSGREAAEAYVRYLEEAGAKRLSGANPDEELVIVDFFGFVEVVFSHQELVAGVHEAEQKQTAERTASEFREKLKNRKALDFKEEEGR
ncbi:MAG: DUF6599 family protein [Desulfosoma sp.]